MELDEIRNAIAAAIERVRPFRVVFDPFSDIRHLAREGLHYRRQVLSLREFFNEHGCTVLLMQELAHGTAGDLQAEALVHGYLTLHQDAPEYGGQRRRLRVHKMRGMPFRDGFHDFSIQTGGIEVYPRLIAAEHVELHAEESMVSGLPHLDALLGGGVERGSSMLIMGAAGVGKSTLATQFAASGAGRGEKGAVFIFDETVRTFRARAEKLGVPMARLLADGTLTLRQIDSAEVSAGQFTNLVMRAVDSGASTVVIDSLTGYLSTMPEERFLAAYLHELLTTLSHRNVLTILTLAQHGLVGEQVAAPIDVSYLSDTVLLIRYFETFGRIRRAISVVKKRSGAHEVAVREMSIDARRHHHRRAADEFSRSAQRCSAVYGRRAAIGRPGMNVDERVLIWAPARDGRLTCGFLTEIGFSCVNCESLERFRAEIESRRRSRRHCRGIPVRVGSREPAGDCRCAAAMVGFAGDRRRRH